MKYIPNLTPPGVDNGVCGSSNSSVCHKMIKNQWNLFITSIKLDA